MQHCIKAIIVMASASAASGLARSASAASMLQAGTMERHVFFRQSLIARGALPPHLAEEGSWLTPKIAASPQPESAQRLDDFSGAVALASKRASTASLDEIGYDEVVKMHSRDVMIGFMRRVMESEGLQATQETMLEQIARYYDGECMKQNYSTLVAEVNAAVTDYKCHNAWTERTKQPVHSNDANSSMFVGGRPTDEQLIESDNAMPEAYAAAASSDSEEVLRDFVKSVVAKKGGVILDERMLGGLVSFYMRQPDKAVFTRLLHEIRAIGDLPDEKAWIKWGGDYASLSNDGYNGVAAGHNQEEMAKFVKRTIASQGLKVRNQGGLNGFLPWYNGECSTQSYDALVTELRSASGALPECGGGWVEPGDGFAM